MRMHDIILVSSAIMIFVIVMDRILFAFDQGPTELHYFVSNVPIRIDDDGDNIMRNYEFAIITVIIIIMIELTPV